MKFRAAIQGVVVLRSSVEDISPPNGISVPEINAAILERYKCAPAANAFPVPQGFPVPNFPLFSFQKGQVEIGGGTIGFQLLNVMSNGLMVVTQSTTEQAGAVVDDLVDVLDGSFGFRFKTAEKKRFSISGVVFQFEKEVEKLISGLEIVKKIINKAVSESVPGRTPMELKRINFASDGPDPTTLSFENIEQAEFVIERRIGHPFSENRFYSGAPMSTSKHVETLEEIEKALMK